MFRLDLLSEYSFNGTANFYSWLGRLSMKSKPQEKFYERLSTSYNLAEQWLF